MLPIKALSFVRSLHILTVVVPFCGLQLYGQGLDPRIPVGPAVRAAAIRGLVRPRPVGSPMATAAASLPQAPGTFIGFDAPGACQTPASFPGCTKAVAINAPGEILGYSVDANGMPHGFLRSSNGTSTSFDVPGAALYNLTFDSGPPGSSLSPAGEATGGYGDANGTSHGFVRDSRRAITTFDAPGADLTPGDFGGTFPLSINASGEVTGSYIDAGFLGHGFLREANGNFIEFDAPGATSCPGGLTYPRGINAAGEIIGFYYDPQCSPHGFLRERNGAFFVFEAPNFQFTIPDSINDAEEVAGSGFDATGAEHGFVRDQRGSFTVFDVPGERDLVYMDINSAGVIAGWYLDANLVVHGYRRMPDGTLNIIDFPGAGTGDFQGTFAQSINAAGVITGAYNDANGVLHGFLFVPQ